MALVSTTRDGETYLIKKGNNLLETGSDIVKLPEGIGCVDLGTLTWAKAEATGAMYAVNALPLDQDHDARGVVCAPYINPISDIYYYIITGNISHDKSIVKGYPGSYDRWIAVHDSDFTDAATFKAAMSGVLLFYKKAVTA